MLIKSIFVVMGFVLVAPLAGASQDDSFWCWSAPDKNHVEKFVEIDHMGEHYLLHTGTRVGGQTFENPIKLVKCTLDMDHFISPTPSCQDAAKNTYKFALRQVSPSENIAGDIPLAFQSSQSVLSIPAAACQAGPI